MKAWIGREKEREKERGEREEREKGQREERAERERKEREIERKGVGVRSDQNLYCEILRDEKK